LPKVRGRNRRRNSAAASLGKHHPPAADSYPDTEPVAISESNIDIARYIGNSVRIAISDVRVSNSEPEPALV
jgi:hypothetical protein